MTASPSRHYSAHCKAAEGEDDPGFRNIWNTDLENKMFKAGTVEEDRGGSSRQSWMESSGLCGL